MYVLGLKTGLVWLLRFEVVQNEDGPIIKIYDSKTNTTKQILISHELYEEIIEYKMSYVSSINIINQSETHRDISLIMDILCLTIQRDQLQRNLTQN